MKQDTILAVDDLEEGLEAIENLLKKDGYNILKAKSGEEALEILKREDVLLILSDVQMPKMNGFEFAKIVSEDESTREIPIVFLTAHEPDEKLEFDGYALGAYDFLYKPVKKFALKNRVRAFINICKRERSVKEDYSAVKKLYDELQNSVNKMVKRSEQLESQKSDFDVQGIEISRGEGDSIVNEANSMLQSLRRMRTTFSESED